MSTPFGVWRLTAVFSVIQDQYDDNVGLKAANVSIMRLCRFSRKTTTQIALIIELVSISTSRSRFPLHYTMNRGRRVRIPPPLCRCVENT